MAPRAVFCSLESLRVKPFTPQHNDLELLSRLKTIIWFLKLAESSPYLGVIEVLCNPQISMVKKLFHEYLFLSHEHIEEDIKRILL